MARSSVRKVLSMAELEARFALSAVDRESLEGVAWGSSRLGFAVVLLMYRQQGRVPARGQLPHGLVPWVAEQVGVHPDAFRQYRWRGRTHERIVARVRDHFGTRVATPAERSRLQAWLSDQAWRAYRASDLLDLAQQWLRSRFIEVPRLASLERWVRSARVTFAHGFDRQVVARLPLKTSQAINKLLEPTDGGACRLDSLRAITGRASQGTLRGLVANLEVLQKLDLEPRTLFEGVGPRVLSVIEDRVKGDDPWHLRRYSSDRKLARAAVALCALRRRLTDDVVTVFLAVQSRNWKKAVAKADRDRAAGGASSGERDDVLEIILDDLLQCGEDGQYVRLFDLVGRERLERLRVALTTKVGNVAEERAVAACERYRRVARPHLRRVIECLRFEARNPADQELLRGLKVVVKHLDSRADRYSDDVDVPMGFAVGRWANILTEGAGTEARVLRYPYEACVLHKLDAALRSKRIWVQDAHRYRDPEQDLPQDWKTTRDGHFDTFAQPPDGAAFAARVRGGLESALRKLDARQADREGGVRIIGGPERWNWKVTPIQARPTRPILSRIKHHVAQRVGTLHLSDALLEAHRHIGLDQFFHTSGQRQTLTRPEVVERLLACLFGLGTNLGLKRVHTAAHPSCSYRDLRYFERRFMSLAGLEDANIALTNRILELRDPVIWPDGMKVASDGKHLAAWADNTINEFNPHYAKYGVMAYWHVETNALCIHVDVNTISRSEVTSMIEGLARHDSQMRVESNAVDSHGQSELGFAVTHLLGVDLLPRLKRIKAERLYLPSRAFVSQVPHLASMVTRPIRWHLIEEQYDEMSRTVAAIARGTGTVESILRRYNHYSRSHPTYRAFLELGKALKTTFLCRYLGDNRLRSEIHDALNVAENWNSCVDFIFYGRQSTLSTNDPERMRKSVACLRLLQNALVLVNTVLVQRVLHEEHLLEHMAPEDFRALTPLFTSHVNACGDFDLRLSRRSVLEAA